LNDFYIFSNYVYVCVCALIPTVVHVTAFLAHDSNFAFRNCLC